jgi:hypothetical protein
VLFVGHEIRELARISWPDCFSLGWARIAGNRMASKVEIGGVESKLDFRIQPMTEGRIPQ